MTYYKAATQGQPNGRDALDRDIRGAWGFRAFSGPATLPAAQCVHQSGNSLNLVAQRLL